MWAEVDQFAISGDTDNILLFEVKIRHTRDAFKQLGRYKTLLASIYPNHHICPIEICQYFDMEEYKTTILDEIRPHSLPHAAHIWEPSILTTLVGIN